MIEEYTRLENESAIPAPSQTEPSVSPLSAHEPMVVSEPVTVVADEKQPSEVSLEDMIQEQKKRFATIDDA